MAVVARSARHEKRREIGLVLFLLCVLAPLAAVGLVGGYGFGVWIWQMFNGPPGPPPP
jgi:nitrate reductase NapE